MNNNLRAYFFGNIYLSSIQQGIQSAHALANMFIRYNFKHGGAQAAILEDWAEFHKTMILLNGGYSETIRDLVTFFETDDNPYPFASFYEGQDALNGALTCVGIILPEKIYSVAELLRNDKYRAIINTLNSTSSLVVKEEVYYFNDWEIELMQQLNKFRLAS